MTWGRHRRCRRWRRVLLASWHWFLLLALTGFIAINSLLYRGINRADKRSLDTRSLPIKEKVISIDSSWQTDEADLGDANRDLYIDSPRHYRGLSGAHQGRVGSSAGATGTGLEVEPPVMKHVRRGDSDLERLSSIAHSDAIKQNKETVSAAKLDYKSALDKKQRRQGRNMTSVPEEMVIGRTETTVQRNHVSIQLSFNHSRLYPVPIKHKTRLSNQVAENRRWRSNQKSRLPVGLSKQNSNVGDLEINDWPPWLSNHDTEILKRLSDHTIESFQTMPDNHGQLGLGILMYEPEMKRVHEHQGYPKNPTDRCNDQGVTCAVIFSPAEIHRILAFHLDRALGFTRTLPTVSRRLPEELRRQVGLPVDVGFPLMLYDPSLYVDEELAEISRTGLSECLKGVGVGMEWCNNVLTEDWGAVALFDFLLQIYHRLDYGCCGLAASERQRRCGGAVRVTPDSPPCTAALHRQKLGCNYRLASGADQLVLVENLVDLQVPLDKLDFRILWGFNSFPGRAVLMLREGGLRRTLLQSLLTDKMYWDGQGGQLGIERIINVIEGRAEAFLKHISSSRS